MISEWYKAACYIAHQGTGKKLDVPNYIYAEDIIAVLDRFKKIPGMKRNKAVTVTALSPEEVGELEAKIIAQGIAISEAKRTWFYGFRK